MLKALEDLILYLIENWRSLTIQGALTAVVLIIVKRIGIQQLKRLLRLKDNAEMERIESKLDLLIKERGIEWSSPRHGLKRVGIPPIGRYFSCSQTGIQSANPLRRMKRMKAYLKKLGKTKLQAYLLASFINIALLVGYLMDLQDIQSKVEAWTPLVNTIIQVVLTIVYQMVEGSVDKASLQSTGKEYTTGMEVRTNETAATTKLNEFANTGSNR